MAQSSSHPDVAGLLGMLDRVNDLQHDLYDMLSVIGDKVGHKTYRPADLVDLGYLCREIENKLDDLRKDAKARKELAGERLATDVAEAAVNDVDPNPTIRGTLATGTTDVKLEPQLPRRGSAEHVTLVSWVLAYLTDDPDFLARTEKLAGWLHSVKPDGGVVHAALGKLLEEHCRLLGTKLVETRYLSEHWVHIGTLVTRLAEDGRPRPAGMGDTTPKFTTTYRKRRN